jgi:hypothetical protein
VLQAAEDHYRLEQRVTALGVVAARRVWSQLDPGDLSGSWAASVGRLALAVAAVQLVAAREADSYVTAALEEQGVDADSAGVVVPAAFAGMAADGRRLDGLLASALVDTKQAIGRGAQVAEAMARGRSTLDMLVATTIQDTGRAAVSTAITARPQVTGYVRMVNPPSCARCAILAGRWYRWNQGFLRHPRCDCRHAPALEDAAGDLTTDPRRLFDAKQIRGLSDVDAKAIRDGADISQVVNMRRGGLYTADGMQFTREGTTRQGLTGSRTLGRRLTPETIYRLASDRAEAIGLLRRHGYIT